MPMLEYAVPWDRQPQEAVGPASTEMAGLWLPGSRNLATGEENPLSGWSGRTDAVGAYGRADLMAGSASGSFGYSQRISYTQALTFILVAEQTGVTNDRLIGINNFEIIPSSGKFQVYISGVMRFEVAIGSGTSWSGTLVYTHDLSVNTNNPQAWLNGVPLVVTRLSTPATPTLNGTAILCNHVATPSPPRQFTGRVYAAGLWPYVISDGQQVSSAPWGRLFAPQIIRVPVSVGGPPPPSSLSQYYQNMIG